MTKIAIITENASASNGHFCVSAPCYRGTEYVRVIAVVIAPFEFRYIQWQVFAADFVEVPHNAALQQRPKAIDGLGMNRTVDVLARAMADNAMLFQLAISGIIVGCDQTDFFRYGFTDEAVQSFCISMIDNTSYDIALALDGTDNSVLAFSAGSWRAFIPMPVFVLAADIGFINFDDTHELAEFRFGESSADAMTHIEGSRIGTEPKHPVHLQCGNALLAGQHKIDDFKPRPHRDIRVFEDRPDKHRESITERGALPALPVEWAFCQFSEIFASATRTTNAMRPTPRNQVGFASIIRRKEPIELCDGHLISELWASHRSAPDV
jgi:hypothetical protein